MTESPRRPGANTTRSGGSAAARFGRNRSYVLGAIAILAIGVIGGAVALGSATPAYACAQEWTPDQTAAPAEGASPAPGYVQPDLGRGHIQPGDTVKFALCPPASGKHVNGTGTGPISPRVYGPDDRALPQGWIHNLEHGAIVILYRCPGDACTDAGQAALKDLFANFPPSPVCGVPAGMGGPIIARFDEMTSAYAVLVWGVVLPLDTFDTQAILDFWAARGDRTNPERVACPAPTDPPPPTVEPAATPTPAAS